MRNIIVAHKNGMHIAKIGAVKDENGKPMVFGLTEQKESAMQFWDMRDAREAIEIFCRKKDLCAKDFSIMEI